MKFEQDCQFVISICKDPHQEESTHYVKIGLEKIGMVYHPTQDPERRYWHFLHFKTNVVQEAFTNKIFAAFELVVFHLGRKDD